MAAFEFALDVQLRAVRRLRGRRPQARRTEGRGLSNVDMALAVLRRTKTPLHVDELIVAIAQRYGVQPARDSLVSALTKKVVAGDRFEKTAPNTFGLRADALG
ncbi:MAG: HTH domain-containing protein [Opitutaceae bacterium]